MWRRLVLPVATSLAVTAVVAVAQEGSSYDLPEPAVAASAVLRMPSAKPCLRADSVRVTVLPPSRVAFASLSIRAGASEVLQLASLAGPASVRVTLRGRRTRVAVSGTTTGGQFVQARRVYRRCRPAKPRSVGKRPAVKRPQRPAPRPHGGGGVQGGGED